MSQPRFDKLDPARNSIRTLQLLPGRWDDEIRCVVQIVNLDDDPKYDALSYVWGDASNTVPIQVNGSSFDATENLIAALRRLRSSTDTKVLWVDSICINQDDNIEKMEQIGLMAQIYKSANTVHLFLGESGVLDLISQEEQASWADPPRFEWKRDYTLLLQTEEAPTQVGVDSRGIIQNLEACIANSTPGQPGYVPADTEELPMWIVWEPLQGLDPVDQKRVDDFFARQGRISPNDSPHDSVSPLQRLRQNQAGAFAIMKMLSNGRCIKSCLHSTVDADAWTGALEVIKHLTNLPWWTRVWVLQEAILNQRHVMAIYGEIVAPIGLIEDSGAILPRHYERGICCKSFWSSLPSDQQRILQGFSGKMGCLESIRQILFQEDQADRLIFLLESTRFKKATDQRDKVYGLLGLIQDCPNPIGLRPDYQLTTTELYVSLAAFYIHRHRNLAVLLNQEVKDTNSPLPSWVPSWGPTYGGLSRALLDHQLSQYKAWLASYGSLPAVATDYPTALSVLAKRITRVTSVTAPVRREVACMAVNNSVTSFCDLVSSLNCFFGLESEPLAAYPPNPSKTLRDAIGRTMIGDLICQLDHVFKSGRVTFDRAYDGDLDMFHAAHTAMLAGPRGMLFIDPDGVILPEEATEHATKFAEENFWYTNEGRLFFKAEGGYIGSAPPGTEIGDEVFLLFGSPVPFVLRDAPMKAGMRDDVSWKRVVGQAYVHGIMDGEAAPGRDDDAYDETEYEAKAGKDGVIEMRLV